MIAPDDPRHGTPAGHNAGCRCDPCGDAKLAYDKRRKLELHLTGQRRLVPSYMAVRRIHALQALGWSVRQIATEAGLDVKTLYDTSLERSTSVWRRNFEPLADAYERLSATIPTGPYTGRTRRYAARKGWAPPLAWDDIDDPDEVPTVSPAADTAAIDEVAVQRVLSGDTSQPTTKAEKVEVVRRWRAAGRSLRSLEILTGWKVERYYTVETQDPDEQVAS